MPITAAAVTPAASRKKEGFTGQQLNDLPSRATSAASCSYRLIQCQHRIGTTFCKQSTPLGGGYFWMLLAQRFTGFSIAIAIEIGVPLSQQLLGFGIGADLPAAVPTTAWGGAIGDSC